jgi:hypothetical protein
MNRAEYRSLLGQLPIKSPTAEDIARLCPHLTPEQAVAAFTTGNGYVACPPLRIRGAFQILSYNKEWVETVEVSREKDGQKDASVKGTKNHPAMIRSAYANRTLRSYADGKKHGDVFTETQYMEEAMAFAEANWGDELILDDWVDVVEFYVQDPTDLVNDRHHQDYPRTKAVLYVTLNRDLNDIINDHSQPESQLFDKAIAEMTLDPLVRNEIKGGRGVCTCFNCAHCGAGLALTACTGCGHRFRDDHFRCGWHTPLSPKMVTFLRESGHKFVIDPEVAWGKEQQR